MSIYKATLFKFGRCIYYANSHPQGKKYHERGVVWVM